MEDLICYLATVRTLKETVCVFEINQVYHVGCNFLPGYTCRIIVIFGTLRDYSLQIITLALNDCYSSRYVFQNGVNVLSQMVFKNLFFCQKAQNVV